MKKFISVLLVMVMTCSLLAGCSQEGGQTEKEEETTQQEAGGEEEETTKEGGYTIGCVIINARIRIASRLRINLKRS